MLDMLDLNNPNERCGFVLHDGTIVEIENCAEDPTRSYLMNSKQALPFIADDEVKATWHTHPQGEPNLSGEDYAGFLGWPDLEHIIIGIRDGKKCMMTYKVEDGVVIACD
ncbi:MAG: Mov34/MPN/PAD-1 family protein [Sphingomonas sp.]|uniref:Mov34/MPN/PAD-1 family protein n=1 Tax=Sphingomonas sp. TaxID=28214 RepID=UPI003F821050